MVGFPEGAWANPAAASLSNDVLLVAPAAVVFMVSEACRLDVRRVWAYVVGSAFIAIGVTFPLFLIARQVRLAARRAEAASARGPPAHPAGTPAGWTAADGLSGPGPRSGSAP